MRMTLRSGIFSVNLKEEVFRCIGTELIYFYARMTKNEKLALALMMISTCFSNKSAALIVIILLCKLAISTVKSCKDRIQLVYPKSIYTLRKFFWDKLDEFGMKYEEDQKLIKNLDKVDFKSICFPSTVLKDTSTTR